MVVYGHKNIKAIVLVSNYCL